MAWLGRGRNGTASLAIEGDRVTINVTGLLRAFSGVKRVEKRGGTVAVSHVRLRPPWMSTIVRLDDWSSFSFLGCLPVARSQIGCDSQGS